MQTFLPLPDIKRSAEVLDYRRLGKQRVECKQLLKALGFMITPEGRMEPCEKGGWNNHPCADMWRGYETGLANYQMFMIIEWIRRGYNNTLDFIDPCAGPYTLPPWFGDTAFHASHRSNLLRKDPVFYGKYGWTEPNDLEYVWPKAGPGPTKSTEF